MEGAAAGRCGLFPFSESADGQRKGKPAPVAVQRSSTWSPAHKQHARSRVVVAVCARIYLRCCTVLGSSSGLSWRRHPAPVRGGHDGTDRLFSSRSSLLQSINRAGGRATGRLCASPLVVVATTCCCATIVCRVMDSLRGCCALLCACSRVVLGVWQGSAGQSVVLLS